MTRTQVLRHVTHYRPRPGDGWLALAAVAVAGWNLYWLVGCFR